jgi:hypothetical protein
MRMFMKSLLALFTLISTPPSFAGQDSGGGGPKAIANDALLLTDPFLVGQPSLDLNIPRLGLSPVRTSLDDYRRAAARLSVETQKSTMLRAEGLLREVKALDGGIVDLDETSQCLPEVN